MSNGVEQRYTTNRNIQTNKKVSALIFEKSTQCRACACPGCYMVVSNRNRESLRILNSQMATSIFDKVKIQNDGEEAKSVDLIGGEPMEPQIWPEVKKTIEIALDRGIAPWLFTNGMFMTPEKAKWLVDKGVFVTMNKEIKKLAIKKFKSLRKKYKGFINIGVDNWRGYRFIFDTVDIRKCKNNCLQCPLYLLLKNEREGKFSSSLYLAREEDKKLFGPQRFLNCKTLNQYKNCYINFLIKKAQTEKEIEEELKLINNFIIIYSKNSNLEKLNVDFKKSLIKQVLKKVGKKKKIKIKNIIAKLKIY